MESSNAIFKSFLDSSNLTNLIKNNTCFKGQRSSVDLTLTSRKFLFKYTSSYETGLSDHHYMIYTMLKFSLMYIEPKQLNYRELKGRPSGLRLFLTTGRVSKKMKDGFYFMWKALCVLKIFILLSWLFALVGKWLYKKTKFNFKIYNATDWTANNYNTHIAQFLKK